MKKIFTITLSFLLICNFTFAQLRIDSDTVLLRMHPTDIYKEAIFYVYNDAEAGDADTAVMIERVMDVDCHMQSTICDDFLCHGDDDHSILSRIPADGKMLLKISFEPNDQEGTCCQDFTVQSTMESTNKIQFVVCGISDLSFVSTSNVPTSVFNLFPNPVVAGNTITIKNTHNLNFEKIVLTNTLGETVYEGSLNSETIISTDGMASGVYTLTVFQQDGKLHNQKVVIH